EFIDKGLISVELRNTGNGRKSSVYTLMMPGVNEQPKPQPCGLGQTANRGAQTAKSASQTAIMRSGERNPYTDPLKREAPSAPALSDLIEGKKKALAIKPQPLPLDWTPSAELNAYGFGIGLT